MKNLKSLRPGFTLIEILVVVSLIGIVIATASGIFIYIIRSNQKTRTILGVKQSGDNAMSIMVNKIRQAESEPADICSLGPTFTPADEITVIINDISNTFTCTSDGITLTQGGVVQELTGTDLRIEGSIDCFTCYAGEFGGPAIVEISFILAKGEATNLIGYVSLPFMSSVSLRTY